MVEVRFSDNKNLDNAMKQLIEWKILEYVEASDSYQTTNGFHEFVKKLYVKLATDPYSFPFKGEVNNSKGINDFFAYLIEQYVGDNTTSLADRRDRNAILVVFGTFVQEMGLKARDKIYEN